MFTEEYRAFVREQLIEKGKNDHRLVSAAVVGSTASGEDRWSDIDLTFGVGDGVSMTEVLADWSAFMRDKFDASQLFDLPFRSSLYRVFLLSGNLQVDISFTPEEDFGAHGPKFKLLWGTAIQKEPAPAPDPKELFGYAVLYLVRARICIERDQLWQAEYLISAARDNVLSLACLHRGVRASHGKGFDNLPADVLESFSFAIVSSVEREPLLLALGKTVEELFRNYHDLSGEISKLENQMTELRSENIT